MSQTEVEYKKAFIKYVNVDLPKLLKSAELDRKSRNAHTEAMMTLARNIRLMPTSIRVRY